MKTIEEKAKAYDEAISRAKVKIAGVDRKDRVYYVNDIEEIFPELKESEDEKIRKEIIDILDSYDVAHLKSAGLPKRIPEYIAWLEKRDEQKCGGDVNDEALQKQLQIWFDKGKCSGIDEVRNNPEKYGLQGEQKPVVHKFRVGDTIHYIKCKENFGIIDAVGNNGYLLNDATFISFKNQDEWKLVEQKPIEWSEEDDRIILKLLELISTIITEPSCHRFGFDKIEAIDWLKHLKDRCFFQPIQKLNREEIEKGIEEALLYHANDGDDWMSDEQLRTAFSYGFESGINWLKSIKDRVQPQQEWSEEDENRINRLIAYFKDKESFTAEDDIVYANWLKSLCPQKKQEWSKEDIEMIDWLIRCCEKEHEELCNNRYGHQEIVSELKRDCRKKWDWLENLKNRIVPQKQWKPSEYEIQLLKDVASGVKDPVAYGASMGVIIGGLEQLKAL